MKKVLSLAIASVILPVSSYAQSDSVLEDVSQLKVISNDCGGLGCADRRGMSLDEFRGYLDASTAAYHSAASAQANGQNGAGSGQGLSIGNNSGGTQLVYLDFDPDSPVYLAAIWGGQLVGLPSYQYSQAERDEITARIAADYEGFDIELTQTEPTEGEYSTLKFECPASSQPCVSFDSGILFGQAQSIDIGNVLRDDFAFVDSGLWPLLVALDPSGGFFSSVSGVPVVNGDVAAALSRAVVNQAANTGAHELGHNLGLRHHDSFGSPGTGIPTTNVPARDDFYPTFDGLAEGDEAILHTMASGASVGTGFRDSTLSDRFFSERSAIKLTANQRGRLLDESAVSGKNKKVQLRKLLAPNTILEGENSEGKLDVREAWIQGSISVTGEVDSYRFKGAAGDFVSAEFNGFDVPVGDPVIGAIELYLDNGDGSKTLVAQNYQNFEGFDAFLIDAELPESGNYIMEVSSPNVLSFGYDANGQIQYFYLDEFGYGDLRNGDYRLSIYKVEGKPGNGVSHVPGS